jgi:hypothetical protein
VDASFVGEHRLRFHGVSPLNDHPRLLLANKRITLGLP